MLALLDAFWRTHAPVLSVLLPAFTAALLLLVGSGEDTARGGAADGARRRRARRIAMTSVLLGALLALRMVVHATEDVPLVYPLGDWPAPFGIVLIVDRLSAMMVLLTYAVAVPVLWYATGGWDTHGRHFHALFQFQLMGLAGAFLTGDLFNLFVFFEVLLIASYALLVHGQGAGRFRVGVHYVVLNLTASAVFLIGLALVYAVFGTLNMADLAMRVEALAPQSAALARTAGLLLLVVFGLKAALLPLGFWLPATYAGASAPVAALFAVMTKVGVYAIIRVQWAIFGQNAAVDAIGGLLLPLALATSVLGVLGALAAHSMGRLVGYLTMSSVGTILVGVALATTATLSAALYYSVHSTLVVAALFLLVELIGAQRGDATDQLRPAPAVREPVLLGLLMLFGAASVAGLPPLPGFLGKLMLLQGSAGLAAQPWVWSIVLSVGFLTILGLGRAGVVVFWHVEPDANASAATSGASPKLVAATAALLLAGVAMAVWAAPFKRYLDATAAQVADRGAHAAAVLGAPDRGGRQGVRPYAPPPREDAARSPRLEGTLR